MLLDLAKVRDAIRQETYVITDRLDTIIGLLEKLVENSDNNH